MSYALPVEGIGDINYQIAEYMQTSVKNKYLDLISNLNVILNHMDGSNIKIATVADYDTLLSIYNDIVNIGRNGLTDNGAQFFFTQKMAGYLRDLLKYFQVVEFPPNPPLISPQDDAKKILIARAWQSLAGFGLQELINDSTSKVFETVMVDGQPVSLNNSHSLQSYVELEYIKAGNDMLAENLGSLEKSLERVDGILTQLTVLQNIANQIKMGTPDNFVFPPNKFTDISYAAWINILGTGVDTDSNQVGSAYSFVVDRPGHPGVVDIVPAIPTTDKNRLAFAFIKRIQECTGSGNFILSNAVFYPPYIPGDATQAYTVDFIPVINAIKALKPGDQLYYIRQNLETDPDPAAGTRITDVLNLIVNTPALGYFERYYQVAASATFTQLFPVAAQTATAVEQYEAAWGALQGYLDQFNSEEPTLVNKVSSIPYLLKNVINDLSTYYYLHSDPFESVDKWILDNQDKKLGTAGAEIAGNVGANLTQAVQAAENLNDSKKKEVQQYMFIFQEFYKSASAILQKVSQILENFAQGISR